MQTILKANFHWTKLSAPIELQTYIFPGNTPEKFNDNLQNINN